MSTLIAWHLKWKFYFPHYRDAVYKISSNKLIDDSFSITPCMSESYIKNSQQVCLFCKQVFTPYEWFIGGIYNTVSLKKKKYLPQRRSDILTLNFW